MLLQVAVLTCREVPPLPPFAALKHLILSTPGPAQLPITYLEHATSLETLSLGVFGPDAARFTRNTQNIDVSSLPALKHVRIDNFVPNWLHVPDGCLLHVVWDGVGAHHSNFGGWARRMQLLWEEQSNCLGSLQISFQNEDWHSYNMAVLRRMLTGDQEPGYVSLCSPELGSQGQPFSVDPSSCQMLARAEKIRFRAAKSCNIRVVGMQPRWKTLSIHAARVTLEVEDTAALVRCLDNFWVDGIAYYGFTGMSMVHELHESNCKCVVRRVHIDSSADSSKLLHLRGFSLGTLVDCAAQKAFKELMCCGCSSCLACLSREGKLSRDSRSPKRCWYGVPVYEL